MEKFCKIADLTVIAHWEGEYVNPKMFYYFSSYFLSHIQNCTDNSWNFACSSSEY